MCIFLNIHGYWNVSLRRFIQKNIFGSASVCLRFANVFPFLFDGKNVKKILIFKTLGYMPSFLLIREILTLNSVSIVLISNIHIPIVMDVEKCFQHHTVTDESKNLILTPWANISHDKLWNVTKIQLNSPSIADKLSSSPNQKSFRIEPNLSPPQRIHQLQSIYPQPIYRSFQFWFWDPLYALIPPYTSTWFPPAANWRHGALCLLKTAQSIEIRQS